MLSNTSALLQQDASNPTPNEDARIDENRRRTPEKSSNNSLFIYNAGHLRRLIPYTNMKKKKKKKKKQPNRSRFSDRLA